MNVLIYDIPCVHNLFSVSSVVYVIHNSLYVHLQTGVHLILAYEALGLVVVLMEKSVRRLSVPQKRVGSHLDAVVVADLHNLIHSAEVDGGHQALLVVVRNVVALVLCLAHTQGAASPHQRIRFHLIFKRDTVEVLFERVEIIRILELT